MSQGHPLNDADRWDWLILLRETALSTLRQSPAQISTSTSTSPPSKLPKGVIITCSALKRKYRDVLRIATYHDPSIRVHFIFLSVSEAALMDRVRARKGHYMKDYMVHSQVESLETPREDERDVLSVDAGGTSAEVQGLAAEVVKRVLKQEEGV